MGEIASMLSELVHNAMGSTSQGFVGVGLIFFYFVLILDTAAMRIKRGDHVSHH